MNHSKYTINNNKVLYTQLQNEGVLYEIATGSYINANITYNRILQGIDKGLDVEQIKQGLLHEFEIDEAACQQQLNAVIAELLQKEFIEAV